MNSNEIIQFYVKCVEDYNQGWDIFEDGNYVIVFFGNTQIIELIKRQIYGTVIEHVINKITSTDNTPDEFTYILKELNKRIPNIDKKLQKKIEVEGRCNKLVTFMLKMSAWRRYYAEKLRKDPSLIHTKIVPIF